jgi:hypothetical protein
VTWRSPAPSASAAERSDDPFGELGLHLAGVLRAAHEAMGDLRHLEERLDELRGVHASIGRALEDAQEQLRASLDRLEPGPRWRGAQLAAC